MRETVVAMGVIMMDRGSIIFRLLDKNMTQNLLIITIVCMAVGYGIGTIYNLFIPALILWFVAGFSGALALIVYLVQGVFSGG